MSIKEQLMRKTGGFKHDLPLDYREVDLTTGAGDKTIASRTVAAGDLFDSKDGSSGEIDKVELWVDIDYVEDSGSANGLDLGTATDNQYQINVGALGADDLPLAIAGSLSGQHVSGDFECPANAGGHVTLMADVSDLTTSTLKDNVDQPIVVTLQNGKALGNNLRLKVTTLLRVYYNGKVNTL